MNPAREGGGQRGAGPRLHSESCLVTVTFGNPLPPSEPPLFRVSNGDSDLCPTLFEDRDVVWDSDLQLGRGSFPSHPKAPVPRSALAKAPGPEPCPACKLLVP